MFFKGLFVSGLTAVALAKTVTIPMVKEEDGQYYGLTNWGSQEEEVKVTISPFGDSVFINAQDLTCPKSQDMCLEHGQFDYESSESFEMEKPFYLSPSSPRGHYAKDSVVLGDQTVDDFEFILLNYTVYGSSMGFGPSSSYYKDSDVLGTMILDMFVDKDLIDERVFSIYHNGNSSSSIKLGGVSDNKYTGSLHEFDLADFTDFTITTIGFKSSFNYTIETEGNSTSNEVPEANIIFSYEPITRLGSLVFSDVTEYVSPYTNFSCEEFEDIELSLGINDFKLDLTLRDIALEHSDGNCMLLIEESTYNNTDNTMQLGTNLLESIYYLVDPEKGTISLAESNPDASESDDDSDDDSLASSSQTNDSSSSSEPSGSSGTKDAGSSSDSTSSSSSDESSSFQESSSSSDLAQTVSLGIWLVIISVFANMVI